MTAVKEQFMQILPQIQRDVPSMPDSEVQQFLNIYVNWKPKQETPEERLDMLHQLCGIFTVVETTGESVIAAAERMVFSDFEDSVVNQNATRAAVEYIVTRNESDYKTADVTIISPTEFLKLFDDLTDEMVPTDGN